MPRGAVRGRARKQVHTERTTRSSKAKNLQYGLEDPEQAEKQLTAQLKAMGLYAANTLGDGNCLFRALSDQLYGYPNQHAYIRHAICDYLQAHPDKYAGFVDDAKPFDAYVRNMREQGTYGGHLELSAFAHLKRKQIKIVQPNLVYVVAANEDEDTEQTSQEGPEAQQRVPPPPDQLPPTTRQLRRFKREARASGSSASNPEPSAAVLPSAAPTSSSSSDTIIPSQDQAGPSSSALANASNSHISASPQASSSSTIIPASTTRLPVNNAPLATASASAPLEATGPLYIAYHNWEHYSSIRNLEGPHSGLPRIREKPINQADLAKEFSTIAAKAARRGGLPLGKGKAKANTQPGTSSLDSDRPSEEEKLIMDSVPGHSLFEVRQLLKLLGSWEDVVEKLVAEDQPDSDRGAGSSSQQQQAKQRTVKRAVATDPSLQSGSSKPKSSASVHVLPSDDCIVITDDDDDVPILPPPPLPAVVKTAIAPPPPQLPPPNLAQRPHRQQQQQQHHHHPQTSAEVAAWRAGSPASVGTATSARSSASLLTAATSSSTSTVPTSDDWNAAESVSSSGMRTPGAGEIVASHSRLGSHASSGVNSAKDGEEEEEKEDIDGEQYIALSPDSTLTAREMSILEEGRGHSEAIVQDENGMARGYGVQNDVVPNGRMSPSAFKRKAHHGHDVGADGDYGLESSNKRFSPARGQHGEGCQLTSTHGHTSGSRTVVPSSVSPSPGSTLPSEPGQRIEGGGLSQRSPAVVRALGGVHAGTVSKSGLTRLDAISIGSASSSDSDVPIGALKRPVVMHDGAAAESPLGILIPPSQQRALAAQRRQLSDRQGSVNGSTGGGSTDADDDSIASSRPKRTSATPIDYRASALGRSGVAGPGQTPVSLTSAQSKRAKRDQKRAEKVERERAKARARRLGRGIGVAEGEDEDEDEDEEDTDVAAVPAQFAFRELRI